MSIARGQRMDIVSVRVASMSDYGFYDYSEWQVMMDYFVHKGLAFRIYCLEKATDRTSPTPTFSA